MFSPEFATRLPNVVDVSALLRESQLLDASAWIQPLAGTVDCVGWCAVPLVQRSGSTDALNPDQLALRAGLATTWLLQCSSIESFLRRWPCPLFAARLLRLEPGGLVEMSSEPQTHLSRYQARLHLPLQTNDRVELHAGQTFVKQQPGECWYVNSARPQRLQNAGETQYVALELDCMVNVWLQSAVDPAYATKASDLRRIPLNGMAQFELFREQVFRDVTLQHALRQTKALDAFFADTVALGATRGLEFSIDDVRAHFNQTQRDWFEQWIT